MISLINNNSDRKTHIRGRCGVRWKLCSNGLVASTPLEGVAEDTAAERGGWSEGKAFPSFVQKSAKFTISPRKNV
jgi:hypothetical protein